MHVVFANQRRPTTLTNVMEKRRPQQNLLMKLGKVLEIMVKEGHRGDTQSVNSDGSFLERLEDSPFIGHEFARVSPHRLQEL